RIRRSVVGNRQGEHDILPNIKRALVNALHNAKVRRGNRDRGLRVLIVAWGRIMLIALNTRRVAERTGRNNLGRNSEHYWSITKGKVERIPADQIGSANV